MMEESINRDATRSGPCRIAAFIIVMATLALGLGGCLNPNMGGGEKTTGSITGHARYANQTSHAGIVISAESSTKGITAGVAAALGQAPARGMAGQTTTDAEGAYTLEGLEPGTYTLYASSESSLEKAITTSVTVEAGREVTAGDLDLTPTGTISGRATLDNQASGNLGILVYLAGTSFQAMSADDGAFTITGVPASSSSYTIVASKDGYDSVVNSVTVNAGATTQATMMDLVTHVVPASTGSVSGVVDIASTTTPISGVFVYIAGTSLITLTDGTGAFLLQGVPPGSRLLSFSRDGYQSAAMSVSVTAGRNTVASTLYLYPAYVSPPTMSPATGTYDGDTTVQLFATTYGAGIVYTRDGTTPTYPLTGTSAYYSSSLSITAEGSTTIRALSYKAGFSNSSLISGVITISRPWAKYGTSGNGTGQFNIPLGIARDSSGRIYIADAYNHRIVRINDFSGAGWVAYGANGAGTGQFSYPSGIAIDSSGRIYIADRGNSRIVRINDMAGTGWTAFGTYGTSTYQFGAPYGVAVDSSARIYVADAGNNRIVSMSSMTGSGWTSFGTVGTATNQFSTPIGVAVDSANRIYIADMYNNRLVRITNMTGAGWYSVGTSGSGNWQFSYPRSIAVDANNRVYATDGGNGRIIIMAQFGTGWKECGSAGSMDGQFNTPFQLTVDSLGKLYVADCNNYRIVRFVPPLF